MITFINTLMIVAAIAAFFVGSNIQEKNENTTANIYYLENGGDNPNDAIHYSGINILNDTMVSLTPLTKNPLHKIPSALKSFISNVTMITSAYQVNANIQTSTNNNSKTLPIDSNKIEIGIDSLSLIMTLDGTHQADMFDALESIIKSSPELQIKSLQFSSNQMTLKINIIGTKE